VIITGIVYDSMIMYDISVKRERSSMLKGCMMYSMHDCDYCTLIFSFFLESANVEAWNGLEVVAKSHHPKWISKLRTTWNRLPVLVGLGSRRRRHAKWVPHCQWGNHVQVTTCHIYIARRTNLWTLWLRMLGILRFEIPLHFVNS
jgi:hypothetical protein